MHRGKRMNAMRFRVKGEERRRVRLYVFFGLCLLKIPFVPANSLCHKTDVGAVIKGIVLRRNSFGAFVFTEAERIFRVDRL